LYALRYYQGRRKTWKKIEEESQTHCAVPISWDNENNSSFAANNSLFVVDGILLI
jgi:RNase H-fold protein (predicted Holliday junction resolvase)